MNKIGLWDHFLTQLPQHRYQLPAVVSAVIAYVHNYLPGSSSKAFCFCVAVGVLLQQLRCCTATHPVAPEQRLLQQSVNRLPGRGIELFTGNNELAVCLHTLPPDTFGIPDMQNGGVEVRETAGNNLLLPAFIKLQHSGTKRVVSPKIISSQFGEVGLHACIFFSRKLQNILCGRPAAARFRIFGNLNEAIMELSTQLIHGAKLHDPSGAVAPPLILSTTFERGTDGISYPGGYKYSRHDNPNRQQLEQKLAILENGTACISFSSGLAAAATVFQSLRSGDHVLLPNDTYFAIRAQLDNLFAHVGISYTLVDMTDLDALATAFRPNTRLVWIETPSNPSLKITDIAAVVQLAKQQQCLTVADNTWATPYHTRPIEMGVDIVLHSTTKYLGGHSDILGGALVFAQTDARYEWMRNAQQLGGAVPSPFECWLLNRSLATFAVRMPVHNANAVALANYLQQHPAVEQVLYPGLANHPGHTIAAQQMQNGFGGMLSVLLKGNRDTALRVAGALQYFAHATSLGGVESLVEHRKSVEGPDAPTPENLLRISVGIEATTDLIGDWEQALRKV